MITYTLLTILAGIVALLAAGLRVHRYSRGHVTMRATLAGRGLYVSKTPDGVWWAVRLRRRACPPASWWPDEGPPGQSGVREPRRPVGPGPLAAADAIDPPDRRLTDRCDGAISMVVANGAGRL
jgi:hypothetical protein